MSEIDVSKCKYYYKHTKICLARIDYMGRYKKCSYVHTNDCYYKQLQQLKQLYEQKTVDNFDLMSQIDKLKAENKKLKQDLCLTKNRLEQFLEKILEFAKYNYKNICSSALNNCEQCVEKTRCGTISPFTRLDFIRETVEELKI